MSTFRAQDRRHTEPDRRQPEQQPAVLDNRPVVDQAAGILMARHGCTADDARQMLSVTSQHDSRRLRDLARAIVDEAQAAED